GVVPVDGVLEHMGATVDDPSLLAFGQQGAVAGGGEDGAKARPRRLQATHQGALGHQFELDAPGPVEIVETLGIRLAGKGAEDLAHPPGADQGGEAGVAVAGVVADDGELPGALVDERLDKLRGHPRHAEAPDQHHGAVGNVGHRLGGGEKRFIDHGSPPPASRIPLRNQDSASSCRQSPWGARRLKRARCSSPSPTHWARTIPRRWQWLMAYSSVTP